MYLFIPLKYFEKHYIGIYVLTKPQVNIIKKNHCITFFIKEGKMRIGDETAQNLI